MDSKSFCDIVNWCHNFLFVCLPKRWSGFRPEGHGRRSRCALCASECPRLSYRDVRRWNHLRCQQLRLAIISRKNVMRIWKIFWSVFCAEIAVHRPLILTAPSLTQIYFWDSKVVRPILKLAGSRPLVVKLKTSWNLKGCGAACTISNFVCVVF